MQYICVCVCVYVCVHVSLSLWMCIFQSLSNTHTARQSAVIVPELFLLLYESFPSRNRSIIDIVHMSQHCQYIRSGKAMIAFKSNKEVEENRPVKPRLLGSEHSLACSAYWHDFFPSDFRLLSSFIFVFPTPLQAQNDIRHEQRVKRVVWFNLFRPTRMTFAVDWNGFEYQVIVYNYHQQIVG